MEYIISIIISLAFLVGLCFCVYSIYRIGREKEQLNEKDPLPGHVQLRRDILKKTPLSQKGENKDTRISLPQLSDLHELTLKQELSLPSSSGMLTVVSILLISGIAGTLLGIHAFLQSSNVSDIDQLGPALRPSMWAVFFTIILLGLRGLYLKRLDSFMAALDQKTLNDFAQKQARSENTNEKEKLEHNRKMLDEGLSSINLTITPQEQPNENKRRNEPARSAKARLEKCEHGFPDLRASADETGNPPHENGNPPQEAQRPLLQDTELNYLFSQWKANLESLRQKADGLESLGVDRH